MFQGKKWLLLMLVYNLLVVTISSCIPSDVILPNNFTMNTSTIWEVLMCMDDDGNIVSDQWSSQGRVHLDGQLQLVSDEINVGINTSRVSIDIITANYISGSFTYLNIIGIEKVNTTSGLEWTIWQNDTSMGITIVKSSNANSDSDSTPLLACFIILCILCPISLFLFVRKTGTTGAKNSSQGDKDINYMFFGLILVFVTLGCFVLTIATAAEYDDPVIKSIVVILGLIFVLVNVVRVYYD
jgi:hypothetical protein